MRLEVKPEVELLLPAVDLLADMLYRRGDDSAPGFDKPAERRYAANIPRACCGGSMVTTTPSLIGYRLGPLFLRAYQ